MDFGVNLGQRSYADRKLYSTTSQPSFKANIKSDSDTFESSNKKDKSSKLKTAAKIGMFLALGPILGGAALLLKNKIDKENAEGTKQPEPQQTPVENETVQNEEQPVTINETNEAQTSVEEEVQAPAEEPLEDVLVAEPTADVPVEEEPAVAEENIPEIQTEQPSDVKETKKSEKPQKVKHKKEHGGQVKKSDFKGIDYAVVERFKVDINKFNKTDDLQDWANAQIAMITQKNYEGRNDLAQIQRREMLKEWFNYVTNENDAYKPTVKLMILTAITKDLKPKTDELPPVLNRGVLADTITEVVERYDKNPKETIDIKKLYETKLSQAYSCTDDNGEIDKNLNGWIKIPSKEHDPEHFEDNVAKMKVLSHKNWCTKSFNAEPYLSKGDFHIYFENGKQKLAVRFEGNKVVELEGEVNNRKIPLKYLETAKQYIADNNFELNASAESQFKSAEKAKAEMIKMKEAIGEEAIENADIEKILPYMGIDVKKDSDGKYIISEFVQPFVDFSCTNEPAYFNSVKDITYDDLGIDENKLLKNVKRIEGHCDLRSSNVTSIENLEYVGKDLICCGRKTINLKNLKEVAADVHCNNANNIDLSNLESIGRIADFQKSSDIKLPKIKHIKGFANFKNFRTENLDSLEDCGGLNINGSNVNSMKNLVIVRGDLSPNGIIKGFENLEEVQGKLSLQATEITNLPKLKTVKGDLDLSNSKIKTMNALETVGMSLHMDNSEVTEMKNLRTIGKDAFMNKTKIKQLDNLRSVGGMLLCTHSNLMSMKRLNNVGGNFYGNNNLFLEDLSSLKTVGGNLSLSSTHIRNLDNLEVVGGNASLHCMRSLRFLDGLITVGGELDVSCNENLYSLNSLQSVGGSCCFTNGHVSGAPKLETVGGNLYIYDNPCMEKEGLSALKKVGGAKFYLGESMNAEEFKDVEFNGTFYKHKQPVA